MKDAPEDQGPVFAPPKDPGAAKFLEQIQIYQKAGDDERFRDACEEAYRIFPEEIQFLYLMTYARRRAGNTGKAVKSGEELRQKSRTISGSGGNWLFPIRNADIRERRLERLTRRMSWDAGTMILFWNSPCPATLTNNMTGESMC